MVWSGHPPVTGHQPLSGGSGLPFPSRRRSEVRPVNSLQKKTYRFVGDRNPDLDRFLLCSDVGAWAYRLEGSQRCLDILDEDVGRRSRRSINKARVDAEFAHGPADLVEEFPRERGVPLREQSDNFAREAAKLPEWWLAC